MSQFWSFLAEDVIYRLKGIVCAQVSVFWTFMLVFGLFVYSGVQVLVLLGVYGRMFVTGVKFFLRFTSFFGT